MSDCDQRQQNMKAYLDGEVSLPERIAIRFHLLRCASCREELSEMQRMSLKLKSVDSGLPTALRDRILGSVSYEDPAKEAPALKPVFRTKSVLAWGGAVASLLIAVALGSKFWNSPQNQSELRDSNQSFEKTSTASAMSPAKGTNKDKIPATGDFDGHNVNGVAPRLSPPQNVPPESPVSSRDAVAEASTMVDEKKAMVPAQESMGRAAKSASPSSQPESRVLNGRDEIKGIEETLNRDAAKSKLETIDKHFIGNPANTPSAPATSIRASKPANVLAQSTPSLSGKSQNGSVNSFADRAGSLRKIEAESNSPKIISKAKPMKSSVAKKRSQKRRKAHQKKKN